MNTNTMPRLLDGVLPKMLLIGFLLVLLWLPVVWILLLVEDRSRIHDEVRTEVGSTWGGPQHVAGPVVTVPWRSPDRIGPDSRRVQATDVLYLLPERLDIDGEIATEVRRRTIHRVVVYEGVLSFAGVVSTRPLEELGVDPAGIRWDEARVAVAVSDLRGLREVPRLLWEGEERELRSPGTLLGSPAVSARVPLAPGGEIGFDLRLELAGNDLLQLVPTGRTTNATLRSLWQHPSFTGAFLPRSHEIGPAGFRATWSVLDLNRPFPQGWQGSAGPEDVARRLGDAAFGVRVIEPVDPYRLTSRSVKYSLLVTALTMIAIFAVERGMRERIHPVQYLLAGAAMVLFYLVLLSLAEMVPFDLAYAVAGVGMVGMVVAYLRAAVRRPRAAWVTGAALVGVHACVLVILHVSDLALLLGSLLLVAGLGVLMVLTRHLGGDS